ncbi:hypothetical protein UFOVP657_53 [uncultured Caudovirales phage]|uniref:Uncharacterized protein n=1 Tax=uncultured Caudovirales phage TaxID=2100421 RepID=A0A6J5MEP5_9CAUD|nr:hypothetical protein UFOVP467_58 [uncultured Caudovirales phage]CAB4156363.1 hypothetical protein UFOVP657_53 [uncultured Caudovirales phage]
MARDFKTSFVFPTQAVSGTTAGVTTNLTQVFRTGFNTLTINTGGAVTTPITCNTSDFFYGDEQVADMYSITASDGTKGDGLYTAAAPLGIRLASISSSVAGLFTATAHGLVQGSTLVFTSVTGGAGVIKAYRPYTVQYVSVNTFYLTEQKSTNFLVTATVVSAGIAYATHPTFGLGPLSIIGQAGAQPEALPGQYVRPLYLRTVVQPNLIAATASAAVNLTNLTVSLYGSHVRGFNGTAGTIADLDTAGATSPYALVASRTYQQVFFDGFNGVPNTGAVFTIPVQTDYPFVRAVLSFGRTETAGGTFAATSTIGVGMSFVTGRENAQV